MKLSNETMEILKHFSTINQGLKFEEGNEILTSEIHGNVRAICRIKEHIPKNFAVFNLAGFINRLSVLDEPDIDFRDDCMIITSGDELQSMRFNYSNEATVRQDNKRFKSMDGLAVLAEFFMPKETMSKIMKACGVLGVMDICLFNEGNTLYMSCSDKKLAASDDFKVELGNCECSKNFQVYFKRPNLKLTNDDFHVTVLERGISIWEAKESAFDELIFYISVEADMQIEDK